MNSAQVAGRVADFLSQRLQNYQPEITVIPARKRNTAFSPDSPELIRTLFQSNLIFLGAGSPTYTVRQLYESRAWHTLVARHRQGATIVLASAATIAASAQALPVYEIYKVGEDLHWQQGLDFFGAYGLSLIFIHHWNNAEGNGDLDRRWLHARDGRLAGSEASVPARDETFAGRHPRNRFRAGVVWQREWGCEYFKTDFMHFGCAHGSDRAMWHTPGMTRIEIWRRVAEMIRNEISGAL